MLTAREKDDTFAYHPAYKRPTDKSEPSETVCSCSILRLSLKRFA